MEVVAVKKTTTSTSVSNKQRGRPPGSFNKNKITNNKKDNSSSIVSPPDLKSSEKPKVVGWSQFPINLFSLTITKKKDDVPSSLLPALHNWSVECCIKAAFATEVGSRAFKLHIQGVFECHYPKTPEYVKILGI